MKNIVFVGENDACFSFVQGLISPFSDEFFLRRVQDVGEECKQADALLFFGKSVRSFAEKLDLHTQFNVFRTHTIVSDLQKDYSYTLKKGGAGREISETFKITELETEKNVRVCFDYADKNGLKVLSIDDSDATQSGKMFRYVVSEVAQDYPNVSIELCLFSDIITDLAKGNRPYADIVLTKSGIGGMISKALSADEIIDGFVCLFGETNFAAYGVESDFVDREIIVKCVSTMFSESFDRLDLSRKLLGSISERK